MVIICRRGPEVGRCKNKRFCSTWRVGVKEGHISRVVIAAEWCGPKPGAFQILSLTRFTAEITPPVIPTAIPDHLPEGKLISKQSFF